MTGPSTEAIATIIMFKCRLRIPMIKDDGAIQRRIEAELCGRRALARSEPVTSECFAEVRLRPPAHSLLDASFTQYSACPVDPEAIMARTAQQLPLLDIEISPQHGCTLSDSGNQ